MGRRSRRARVDHNRSMVMIMDAEERQAILDQARATLHRVRDVRVERRDHGAEYWERPEPAPAPAPQPHQPTVAEIEALRSQDWARFVDGRITATIAAHDELWRDVHGAVIAEERKRWRTEVEKLRSEHDLRISALLSEVEKLQRGIGDRSEVIDLPALPMRSARRAG